MLRLRHPAVKPMRVVYEAAHLIDAYLVRGALEAAGIPVFVRGEHLTGAMGELPVTGMVAVCVPASAYAEASAIAAEVEAGLRASRSEVDDGPVGDPGPGMLEA